MWGKQITVEIINTKERTPEHTPLAKEFEISTQDVQSEKNYLLFENPQKATQRNPLEMGGVPLAAGACHVLCRAECLLGCCNGLNNQQLLCC